jgi:hypothetical protein
MLYWAFIGLIDLLILTWQDYTNNRLIDDRLNFFMFGVSYSLITHFKHAWYYYIILLISIMIFLYYIDKKQLMGKGDTSALRWILYGFGIINIIYLFYYLIGFFITWIGFYLIMKYIYKETGKTQGLLILLIPFAIMVINLAF